MEITWYGHSCFRMTQDGFATVVTDPFDHQEIGFNALNLSAKIVTVSHDAPGHSHLDAVADSDWQIIAPGEYEVGNVFLTALANSGGKNGNSAEGRNMTYVFDYDGVTVVHLGDMTKVPSRKDVEAYGNVSVLLVPVGGGQSLNASKAAEVINLIEPGIVIPMHYAMPDAKIELNELQPFLKQMGISTPPEPQDSLKVTERDIPEDTRVVILNPA